MHSLQNLGHVVVVVDAELAVLPAFTVFHSAAQARWRSRMASWAGDVARFCLASCVLEASVLTAGLFWASAGVGETAKIAAKITNAKTNPLKKLDIT